MEALNLVFGENSPVVRKLLEREKRGVDPTEILAFLFRHDDSDSLRASRDLVRDLIEHDAPASSFSSGYLSARKFLFKTLDDRHYEDVKTQRLAASSS